jgi:adenosylhomocysteine nucleosidase
VITGIVVALPEELTTLTTAKVEQGEIYTLSENILIAFSGAGPDNANKAAQRLHENGARRLISWGCAAAISPAIHPGDLVMPARVTFTGKDSYHTDETWLQYSKHQLADDLSIVSGDLAGSASLVTSSTAKKALHQETKAIALDMESYAIAEFAVKNKLSLLIIRAIADPAEMSLPTVIGKSMSANGTVNLSRLLIQLLLHPWQIPALIKLGLHFKDAKQTLRSVAQNLDKIMGFNPDSDPS